jgi:PAS domain S-box-containing protein
MITDPTHLTSLFENATEGIILTNGKGEIIMINPAAQRMFDYTSGEIVGKPIENLIPHKFTAGHIKSRNAFYQHPQNRQMGYGRELFGKSKNNTEIPVEVSLSFYTRNDELFVIAFIVDITHRKKFEQSITQQQKELETMTRDMRKLNADLEVKVEQRTMILKEALQKLEESQQELSEALSKEKQLNEIKSRFVSMASHEFRTPLSTVLSSAALLRKYTLTDEQDKRERHIKRIKDSVKHLNDLLEDFLSLGKLEEGKIHAKTELFDVKEFMEETVEEMKTLAKEGQQIYITYSGLGTFVTDKKLLKNLLINLLSNAFKFSDEHRAIELDTTHVGDKLILSVTDHGIGISGEDQEHIFSSFFRGKNAVNIQGTGLGLHIVKRYVELINGEISLKSELNKGTIVTVELPDLTETMKIDDAEIDS